MNPVQDVRGALVQICTDGLLIHQYSDRLITYIFEIILKIFVLQHWCHLNTDNRLQNNINKKKA